MGNQVVKETEEKDIVKQTPNCNTTQPKQLKSSGTTPDLHFQQFKPLTQTVKHQRDLSHLNGFSSTKSKQQVLSAMTSRVLLREKQNSTANLKSFASTCNLHSKSGFNKEDLFNNSQQIINNVQFSHEKRNAPFQNISNNVVPRNLGFSYGSPECGSFPFNSANYPDQLNQSQNPNAQQFQQSQYNSLPPQLRFHSKSAHVPFSVQPTENSQNQSPTAEFNNSNYIDPYKMQQRLLRKLKNSRKKQQNFQQQQPKQKKQQQLPKYDENYNMPLKYPNMDSSSSKKANPQPVIFFDCIQQPQLMVDQQFGYQGYASPPQYVRTLKFGDQGEIVPSDIVMTFIKYDSMLFLKFLMLSPSWHTSVLQAVDEYCNKLENQFIQANIEYLFYKQSFTQSMPIKFCREQGLRLDRVIECELLPHKQLLQGNKMLKLGYQYKVYGHEQTYRADFKIDIMKKGKPRFSWLHQDSINQETYTQPIQQICIGDSIELSMSLFSLQGFIYDLQWDEPIIGDTPKLSVFNYNKDWARRIFTDSSIKIFCDLNRICELEDAVVEWYEEAYYQRRADLYDLRFLKEHFEIKEIQYAGVDGAICKAIMTAKHEGTIEKPKLGLQIIVKSQNMDIQNEVKRIGYLKDREIALQVRVGDTLIVYISKSSA